MDHEYPTFEELAAEEAVNQESLVRDRNLKQYNQLIFQPDNPDYPEDSARPWPERDAYHALLADLHHGDLSIKGLVRGLAAQKPYDKGPVHWADMGSGYMTAEQELKSDPEFADELHITGVDLHPLTPETIVADSTTVELNPPADLITAVHHSQYLPDQIAAICNWYNQLSDNGAVIVASGHNLSEAIKSLPEGDVPVAQRFLRDLEAQGVPHAAFGSRDPGDRAPGEYSNLAIRKVPGTKLTSHARLVNSAQHYGHRTGYYDGQQTGLVVELVPVDQ